MTTEQTSKPLLEPQDFSAAVTWLVSKDTGSSSLYLLATALCGHKPSTENAPIPYPRDEDDLGRCLRLLECAPSARKAFPLLKKESWAWAALIPWWESLEETYRDSTEDTPGVTALMDDLLSKARPARPKEEFEPVWTLDAETLELRIHFAVIDDEGEDEGVGFRHVMTMGETPPDEKIRDYIRSVVSSGLHGFSIRNISEEEYREAGYSD